MDSIEVRKQGVCMILCFCDLLSDVSSARFEIRFCFVILH